MTKVYKLLTKWYCNFHGWQISSWEAWLKQGLIFWTDLIESLQKPSRRVVEEWSEGIAHYAVPKLEGVCITHGPRERISWATGTELTCHLSFPKERLLWVLCRVQWSPALLGKFFSVIVMLYVCTYFPFNFLSSLTSPWDPRGQGHICFASYGLPRV